MDTLESPRIAVRERLHQLRAAQMRHGLAAYLVPSSDPHLSEYLPERWRAREWLSGFTGSAGTLIVTDTFAGLWVDGRYWVQAETQLAGTGVTLMKISGAASNVYLDWLAAQLAHGATLGVDGNVLALNAARALLAALGPKDVQVRFDLDLIEEIWRSRPGLPTAVVVEQKPDYAPTSRASKLEQVRSAMRQMNVDWHLVSSLDDIAWILNLRGSDVPYNPVFVAHLLIGLDKATLFIAHDKIDATVAAHLGADGVDIRPYQETATVLGNLPAKTVLLVDPRRTSFGLTRCVPGAVTVIETINPSTMAKSQKSAAEVAHIRVAMEQDGAALADFFAWFERALGNETITELTIDLKITEARATRRDFVSPSFATIAGFNANGAMPHYRATPASHAVIEGHGLLLIDSGAQYQYGTTDITRVVPVGSPSAEQKRDFTLVLKGMIALSLARFPRGTRAPTLDALARAPIWAAGIDYGHGTGHGVGYFLNVHEGPQSISPHAAPEPQTAMEPGMITSNEPGIYRPGQWGVRIENLLLNVPAETTEFGEFLCFETLTLCPIDTRCIDRRLLRVEEIDWVNTYHTMVRNRLSPHVFGEASLWLLRRTEPI